MRTIKRGRNPEVTVAPDGQNGQNLIRGWAGICEEIGKSRVQLWRDIRAGKFPPPIEIGPNALAWYRSEIDEWKASRPRRTYGAPSAAPSGEVAA